MSQKEVERFSADVEASEDLLRKAYDGAVGLDQLVERARSLGYDFDLDDAKAFIASRSAELTQRDLEKAAGGIENPDVIVTDVVVTSVSTTATQQVTLHATVAG